MSSVVSRARYAVLRCVADPGRQEALNLGLVAWTDNEIALRVDRRAARRIARQSLNLAARDLVQIGDDLDAELKDIHAAATDLDETLKGWMTMAARFPFSFSEVRQTTIGNAEGLEATVERLTARVVSPPRAMLAKPSGPDPVARLAKSLGPLIRSRKAVKSHCFEQTRSGVQRRVDIKMRAVRMGLDEQGATAKSIEAVH